MKFGRLLESFSVLDSKLSGRDYWEDLGVQGKCRLFYDPVLDQHYEEYTISSYNADEDLQVYQFRKDQWKNMIAVRYVSESRGQDFSQMKIYTERMFVLLNQMSPLKFVDSIYLIKECLAGYQAIMETFGCMEINDHMIGINEQGRPRVWINSRYEKNHPEIPIVTLSIFETMDAECKMVGSLLQAIQKHTQPTAEFLVFRYTRPKDLNFLKARNFIYEYISIQRLKLPQCLVCYVNRQLSTGQTQGQNQIGIALSQSITINNVSSAKTAKAFNFIPDIPMLQMEFNKERDYLTSSVPHFAGDILLSARSKLLQSNHGLTDSVRHTIGAANRIDFRLGKAKSHWRIGDFRKETKYFGKNKTQAGAINQSEINDLTNTKASYLSKDLTFKSTTQSQRKRKCFPYKGMQNDDLLMRGRCNLDQLIQSSSEICEDSLLLSGFNHNINSFKTLEQRSLSKHPNFPISNITVTKSVMVQNQDTQKRQQYNPQTKTYSLNKDMENRFRSNTQLTSRNQQYREYSTQGSTPSTPPKYKPKNLASLAQYRGIKKSVMKGSPKEESPTQRILMISQLKTSFFNKVDDLKQSEIISEHLNQHQEIGSNPPSPLLHKARASGLKGYSTMEQLLGLTKCSGEDQDYTLRMMNERAILSTQ